MYSLCRKEASAKSVFVLAKICQWIVISVYCKQKIQLGSGFKYVFVHPDPWGFMIQFDLRIFLKWDQMGWFDSTTNYSQTASVGFEDWSGSLFGEWHHCFSFRLDPGHSGRCSMCGWRFINPMRLPWDWVYVLTFTICLPLKSKQNVGKYSIHGWYGNVSSRENVWKIIGVTWKDRWIQRSVWLDTFSLKRTVRIWK